MSETHINAFYLDIQEKQQAVEAAQAELDSAKVRLKSHPDYVAPEVKPEKPQEVTRSAKNGQFVDKDEAKKKPNTTVTERVNRE